MSYLISGKQYLAPSTAKTQYIPLLFTYNNVIVENIDVSFGHPLYTEVVQILHVYTEENIASNIPIIPDGCMSLVFVADKIAPKAYFVGVIDEVNKLLVEPNTDYIIIKYAPGASISLIKESANYYSNKVIPLNSNLTWIKQIFNIWERENDLAERIKLISKIIRVNTFVEVDNYLAKYCIDRIVETNGNIKIDSLSKESGVTTRHIGKTFENVVGISPKLFSQIIKLQSSMTRILEEKESLLVDIAIDCGFFDHAHMNRMYKKLVHCASGDFRKNQFTMLDYSQLKDYISDNNK